MRILAVLGFFGAICAHASNFENMRSQLEFLSQTNAAESLISDDAFFDRLSAFDRAARMKVSRAPSKEEFLKFVQSAAQFWTESEVTRIKEAFFEIDKKLAGFQINYPDVIHFIKTSGEEEGHAPYTRGNAIVLPKNVINGFKDHLVPTLVHELFHILSKNDPRLRRDLYRLIGFRPIEGKVVLDLGDGVSTVTNPDGAFDDYSVYVSVNGEEESVVPILVSDVLTGDIDLNFNFFKHIRLVFLKLKNSLFGSDGGASEKPYFEMNEVAGYFEQIGVNSKGGLVLSYIHPDEVMAENFVKLVLKPSSSKDRILEQMLGRLK